MADPIRATRAAQSPRRRWCRCRRYRCRQSPTRSASSARTSSAASRSALAGDEAEVQETVHSARFLPVHVLGRVEALDFASDAQCSGRWYRGPGRARCPSARGQVHPRSTRRRADRRHCSMPVITTALPFAHGQGHPRRSAAEELSKARAVVGATPLPASIISPTPTWHPHGECLIGPTAHTVTELTPPRAHPSPRCPEYVALAQPRLSDLIARKYEAELSPQRSAVSYRPRRSRGLIDHLHTSPRAH
jgi:hypothetical protein